MKPSKKSNSNNPLEPIITEFGNLLNQLVLLIIKGVTKSIMVLDSYLKENVQSNKNSNQLSVKHKKRWRKFNETK